MASLVVLVGFVATQSAEAQKVLFHGSGATASAGTDGDVLAYLESLFGAQNVTYMQSIQAAADGSSANGFNGIVISSTTNSGDLLKYADTPLGVLNWESALTRDDRPGEYFLSEGGATVGGQTQITINDPTHPLAAGLSGDVTVFNSPQTMSFGNGNLGTGVDLVGSLTSDPNSFGILAAEAGSPLLGNGSPGSPSSAPGRRVMFFLQDAGFSSLTDDGRALFNAALEFSLGLTEQLPYHVGGSGSISGTQFLQAKEENVVTGTVQDPVGVVYAEAFHGQNINTYDMWRNLTLQPDSEGVMPAPILWSGGRDTPLYYPPAFGFPDPPTNQEQYSVRVTGQILIPTDTIRFRDGNDDYAGLTIDLDGDGDLSDETPLIDDNNWTDENGDANPGAPVAEATFTNLTAGDDWRNFEFLMAEGTGGDFGVLVWDWNDANGSFPAGVGNVGTATHGIQNGDDLVPSSHLRAVGVSVDDATVSFDASLKLADINPTFSFDVDVEQLEWDKIGLSIPAQIGNNTPDSAVLDLEGVTINLNLTSDPTPGFTVDLIDNRGITEVTGMPTFTFSHGDPADWDTSDFLTNGQLRFGGGPAPGLPGDYNGNGTVEQADLDLVLLNWGTGGVPAGWVNDLPDGNIDQAELDGVLLNWGNMAALGSGGGAGVPEPGSMALLLAAGFALTWRLRRLGLSVLAVLGCLVGFGVESSLAQMEFAGTGIKKTFLTGEQRNAVTMPAPDSGLGYLSIERYAFSPDPYGGRYDSYAAQQAYEAANDPVLTGTVAAPIYWTSGNYPAGFGLPNSNQDNYGIVFRGEMFIPGGTTFLDFKDGNDDITSLIIDTNGDGSFDDELTVIDDSTWTGPTGVDNGGSPSSFSGFSGVAPAGSWRKFEFRMAEGGGGDNGALAWSGTDADFDFPFANTDPFGTVAGDDLIPPTHLRSPDAVFVLSFDYVVDLTDGANFDVNVAELEWDRIAVNNPPTVFGDDPEITSIVDFTGGVVNVRLSGDPVPGLAIDLINDRANVDQILGPASFTFSHGDSALWDTSSFSVNGQISYAAGAAQALAGDFNGNGRVEQSDLDLVLLNWGQSGSDLPQGWITSPPAGDIDQGELDAVLLNWGTASGGLGAPSGVPEPSTVALMMIAAGAGLGLVRRR